MYGHVEKLAEEIKKGAASVEGVEAKLWQVCAFLCIHPLVVFELMIWQRKRKKVNRYMVQN